MGHQFVQCMVPEDILLDLLVQHLLLPQMVKEFPCLEEYSFHVLKAPENNLMNGIFQEKWREQSISF